MVKTFTLTAISAALGVTQGFVQSPVLPIWRPLPLQHKQNNSPMSPRLSTQFASTEETETNTEATDVLASKVDELGGVDEWLIKMGMKDDPRVRSK